MSSDDSTSFCWPEKWIAEEFPSARILSVSYDSCARRGQGGTIDLYCIAENLLQDLISMSGQVGQTAGCPVILVGQDVGGWIIKAICISADGRKVDRDRYHSFLTNLKGILFYATPHVGVSRFPAKFDSALAKNLGILDPNIGRLNHEFSHLRSEKKWETKGIGARNWSIEFQMEVEESSSRHDMDEYYTADAEIDTICKPQARTEIGCNSWIDFIRKLLRPEPEPASSKTFKLQPLQFPDDNFYVPMKRSLTEVRDALKSKHIVVLHGEPGTGKTYLARYLALRFQKESRRNDSGLSSSSDQVPSFSDGVVYLTCGSVAVIVNKQRELLRKFGVEIATWPLGDELRELLHERLVSELSERQALVVLDDVWDSQLSQNVLVPGAGVKYLVTSQHKTLWRAGDSATIRIQGVDEKDGRRILANYAELEGYVIPEKLEGVANEIITQTDAHPLSLANLGIAIGCSSGNKFSADEWEDLRDSFLEQLKETEHNAVAFGIKYPLSVHASMMLMVDLLAEDFKQFFYAIVLFEGPSLPETIVQLFLMYSQVKDSLKVSTLRRRLEARGLVRLEQEPVFKPTIVLGDDKLQDSHYVCKHGRKVLNPSQKHLSIIRVKQALIEADVEEPRRALLLHALRRQFILTTETEAVNALIHFLDSHKEFLHLGERSGSDLATALCALYGMTDIREKAREKMGSSFIWSESTTLHYVKQNLKIMVDFMIITGQPESQESRIAMAATEVFWKLFIKGELDYQNILYLLDVPKCTMRTCRFLFSLPLSRPEKGYAFSVAAFPGVVSKLLELLSSTEESIKLEAVRALKVIITMIENTLSLEQVRGCLQSLAALIVENLATLIISTALLAIGNLVIKTYEAKAIAFAIPGLFKRTVELMYLSPDTIQAALAVVSNLTAPWNSSAVATQLLVDIAKFPHCLERLIRLLGNDVPVQIKYLAVWALANLSNCDDEDVLMYMLEVPRLVESLVQVLSKSTQSDTCLGAVSALRNLARPYQTTIFLAQFPGCVERLVELLLDPDVKMDIQLTAVVALALIARCNEDEVRINMLAIPGLLDAVVNLLSKNVGGRHIRAVDVQKRCEGAAAIIINLASAPANRIVIVQFPGCLERFVGLLAQDVKMGTQEPAMDALTFLTEFDENIARMCQVYRDVLATPGLLKRLVQLLAEDVQIKIQVQAATVLANLASSAETSVTIFATFGLRLCERALEMMWLPQNSTWERCWAAATLLQNFSIVNANQVAIIESPHCLDRLVQLLAPAVDVEERIHEDTAGSTNLAECEEDRARTDTLATLPQAQDLVRRLSDHDMIMRNRCILAAAATIANLADIPANQGSIAKFPHAIERLILLSVADVPQDTQQGAAWAFKTLPGGRMEARGLRQLAVLALKRLPRDVIKAQMTVVQLPDCDQSKLYWEWSYLEAKRQECPEALSDITQALELDAENEFFWQERGVLRRLMGDFEGALEDLNRALEMGPDGYECLKHRGLVKYKLNDVEGAHADAAWAIQVRPSTVDSPTYGRGCLGVLPVEFLDYKLK